MRKDTYVPGLEGRHFAPTKGYRLRHLCGTCIFQFQNAKFTGALLRDYLNPMSGRLLRSARNDMRKCDF